MELNEHFDDNDSTALTLTPMEALPPHLAQKLELLKPGSFCQHRSWGFGRITTCDTEKDQVVIDFPKKPGHTMTLEYAAQSLTPESAKHVLARKIVNLEELRQEAKTKPVDFMRNCVESLGADATFEKLEPILSPDIVPAADWKKWWDSAKRAMRKDGHFALPTRKQQPIQLLGSPDVRAQQALQALRDATAPKPTLAALNELIKRWSELKDQSVGQEVAALLRTRLSQMQKTTAAQIGAVLELALARDEFCEHAGIPLETEGPGSLMTLLPKSTSALGEFLQQVNSSRQARVLQAIQVGQPAKWSTLFLDLLPNSSGKTAEVIFESFEKAGRTPELVQVVQRRLRERSLSADFLHWICKNRPEPLKEIFAPSLMTAILAVLEQNQLSEARRSNRLYELLLNDKDFVHAMLNGALLEDVRDITRGVLLSPVFEELDRRSLLATIVKLHPEMQPMIVGERASENVALIVSWKSLERRQAELEELVTRKIPDNTKEIAVARSYGDLRENHEFKAAKEMQTILMRRKAELESMLSRAQGTDFASADTSKVSIGTTVRISKSGQNQAAQYTILGAWDSEPEHNIISYLTPVAKALLDRKVGESVTLPLEDGSTFTTTIESIAPHKG